MLRAGAFARPQVHALDFPEPAPHNRSWEQSAVQTALGGGASHRAPRRPTT